MPNPRVRRVLVPAATVLALLAVITSVAMLQGRGAAASTGTLPGYYQRDHALVTRLLNTAKKNAANKKSTMQAAVANGIGESWWRRRRSDHA